MSSFADDAMKRSKKHKEHWMNYRNGDYIGEECPVCSLQLRIRRAEGKNTVFCFCGFEEPYKGWRYRDRLEWLETYMYYARTGRRRTYQPANDDDIFRWDSWE